MREPRILGGGALEDVLVMALLEATAETPWPVTDPRADIEPGVALVILRPDEPRACTAVVRADGVVATGFGDQAGAWPPDWSWTKLWT